MPRVSVRILVAAGALLAFSSSAPAQTTNATIVGDMSDPEGGRIAGAIVKVKNVGTGVERELTTNDLGS